MTRGMAVAVAAVVLIVGGGAAWWFSQGTETPTVDVTAPPVATTTSAAATDTGATTATEAPGGGATTYALTEQSQATFTITEELRGTPTTVVGISSIVLGEILVDPEDPAATLQIGTILINARDFTTDSGNRNRAIRGPILDADTFEFVEFSPTSVDGVTPGSSEFTVTGDLTIRDVTHPVRFEVTGDSNDDGTLSGIATATVDRTEWGLDIPSAPGVANVSENVTLTLDFVAARAS